MQTLFTKCIRDLYVPVTVESNIDHAIAWCRYTSHHTTEESMCESVAYKFCSFLSLLSDYLVIISSIVKAKCLAINSTRNAIQRWFGL